MAPDTRRSQAALPPAVHRSALLGELESDDRQESALWVAKQHGHGIETMLRVYAAWADGAVVGMLLEDAGTSCPRCDIALEESREFFRSGRQLLRAVADEVKLQVRYRIDQLAHHDLPVAARGQPE
jgi:hypothetical protein